MSRALPISGAVAESNPGRASTGEPNDAEYQGPLSGTVAVFDPAMCCSTGVCGPGVDPALLALARDLRWLTARGVNVQRFGLSQEPQAFVDHPRVTGLMQAFGDAALPAVLINGEIRWHGRYPTRSELTEALTVAPAGAHSSPANDARKDDTTTSCCTPESGCC
jgi:hypothetical protein